MTQLDILTVQDVADRLRISKSSVYELTRFRGSMRGPRLPVRKVGRHLRFVAAEVDKWFLSLPLNVKPRRRKVLKKKMK
jgi:excisionase family DNA binding protein